MTERRDEGPDNGPGREADLRERLPSGSSGPGHSGPSSGYGARSFEPPPEMKLPPVWPGDEKQPWFRRERGLPPLPEEKKLGPGDFPTSLAPPQIRARAWGLGYGFPIVAISFPIYALALIGLVALAINIGFFYRGQDTGSRVFKTRVLRENGDVAGFFHMWTRAFASVISLLAFGAGFWTALSDPDSRTWHDKWLKTYVVMDSEEYQTRKRSSSGAASNWFWITLLLFIVAPALLAILTSASGSSPSQQ